MTLGELEHPRQWPSAQCHRLSWAPGRSARAAEELLAGAELRRCQGGKVDPAALQNKLWLCMKSIFSIDVSKAAATTIITSGSAATMSVRVTQDQLFLASSKSK